MTGECGQMSLGVAAMLTMALFCPRFCRSHVLDVFCRLKLQLCLHADMCELKLLFKPTV